VLAGVAPAVANVGQERLDDGLAAQAANAVEGGGLGFGGQRHNSGRRVRRGGERAASAP